MKTKGLLILLAIFSMTFSSCEKEETLTPSDQFDPTATGENPGGSGGGNNGGGNNGGGNNGGGGGNLPVGEVPASFTKKVVLEENTGEWCGWCPYGAQIMEENIANNPGRVIGIGVHDGDPMELADFNTFQKQITGVGGFPQGSVDRADASGRGMWTSQITSQLNEIPELGVAIDAKENGGTLDVDVYIGYNSPINENTKLTVMLIENDVPESPQGQSVFDNGDPNTTLDPLPAGWMHSHVLRAVITNQVAGDDVDLTSDDKYTKVSITGVDLSSYTFNDVNNVHIAAFVHNNDNPGRKIYNAQETSGLTEVKKWE